jgi:polyvinyl alcohol dehydrogenase (cytochrome)
MHYRSWCLSRFLLLLALTLLTQNLRAEPPTIGPATAGKLQLIWSTELKGASRATPVLDGEALYVPNTNGYLYKIDARTGAILNEIELSKALSMPGALTGKSVAVTDHAIIFGLRNGPIVVALDKSSGALLWKTTIDDFHGAVITQTPLVTGGRVFIGVSGLGEEVAATTPPYECCGFRGSMLALDADTGRILWKHYTVPPHFAGGSIWSSQPLMDEKRHSLYVTTGNAFKVPPEVQACVDAHKGDEKKLPACYPKDVWYDSILALDPRTGAIKWGFRAENSDIFTGACLVRIGGYCGGGEDFDFGNGALAWRAGGQDLVGAGQKAGIFWALDADTGKLAWRTTVGPGGPNGGIEYGSAVDDKRVYVAEGNTKQVAHDPAAYTLPSGQTINYGSYAALDAATGKILWQIPDPAGAEHFDNGKPCNVGSPREDCAGAFAKGAVTAANGVVFGCSTAPRGPLYAFDGATGERLWRFEGGASCDTKALVTGQSVYWIVGKTLYAFALTPSGAPVATPTRTAAIGTHSVNDGVYRADQAATGKELYLRHCSTGCHNPNLTGAGPTPGLAGPDFLARWSNLSLADLFKRVRETMPKMQPGSLSNDEYLSIIAYLLSANGFPPGPQPLAKDPSELATIAVIQKR